MGFVDKSLTGYTSRMLENSTNPSIDFLDNGLCVVVEEIPHLQSASYTLLIPAGLAIDHSDYQGSSLILAELAGRGAGQYDSRQLSDAFDALGIRHGEGVDINAAIFRGSLLAEHIDRSLELTSKIICEPRLPENEIASIRSLLLQDLDSLEDNPGGKTMLELRKLYLPDPFGRSSYGERSGLERATRDFILEEWKNKYRPDGSILSVAGKVTRKTILGFAKQHFGGWQGKVVNKPQFGAVSKPQTKHIPQDKAQLHIGLAFASVPFGHKLHAAGRVGMTVLSGGLHSRLYVEVREKRGLCYHLSASLSARPENGSIFGYVSTTPERGQETLDVMLAEFKGLKNNLDQKELDRAKANLKASLIMAEEAGAARAAANASSWLVNGRLRTLAEIKAEVDRVSIEDVYEFANTFPPNNLSLVTLGSQTVRIPD